ncbi:MAG: MarR family transcriptional regulator [Oscillospiraceae bacterium]|jgi:DNA-binding MarR family transcriptional regulator|nr:MarR family transcriptional regulator [Oscillospiraceae bacterium]
MDYTESANQLLQVFAAARNGSAVFLHRQLLQGEAFTLHMLSQREDGTVQPGELAAAAKTSTARVAATLGSLEQKGLVTRQVDPSDRRKVLVSLTPQGREDIQEKQQHMRALAEKMLRALGEDDARELLRLARRLLELKEEISAGSCAGEQDEEEPRP